MAALHFLKELLGHDTRSLSENRISRQPARLLSRESIPQINTDFEVLGATLQILGVRHRLFDGIKSLLALIEVLGLRPFQWPPFRYFNAQMCHRL